MFFQTAGIVSRGEVSGKHACSFILDEGNCTILGTQAAKQSADCKHIATVLGTRCAQRGSRKQLTASNFECLQCERAL